MKLSYQIDHASLAILLGDAHNSKSFADRSWGISKYHDICERFYQMYTQNKTLDIDIVSKELEKLKIDGRKSFDNFALNYVQENLNKNSNITY